MNILTSHYQPTNKQTPVVLKFIRFRITLCVQEVSSRFPFSFRELFRFIIVFRGRGNFRQTRDVNGNQEIVEGEVKLQCRNEYASKRFKK